MRTTLDLPEDLLRQAMKASRIRTKTGVIIAALHELVRTAKVRQLKSYRGQIPLDIDLETLRGRRR